MNYVEKYVDFLEGKLGDNEMHQFANQFANNVDFRDNFRQYLHLTRSLNESVKYFTPSSQVQSAVFSSLGLNPNAGAAVVPTGIFKAPFMKSKLFAVMSSCFLTFVVTYLMMMNTNNDVFAHSDFASTSSIMEYHQYLLASNDKPLINKSDNITPLVSDVADKAVNNIRKIVSKAKSVTKTDVESVKPEAVDLAVNQPDIAKSDFDNSNLSANLMNGNSSEKFAVKQNVFPEYDTIFFIRSYDSKLRFEFKNTPSWYPENTMVQPYQISKFNNLEVSMYYPIFKGLMLGGNFRQETFYVEYEGINSKGQSARMFQHPNLTTYSILLRYNPLDISDKVKPFGQVSFGTNLYGPVIREMAGIEFYPFDNVYFVLGGELNQLLFTHDEKWYNAGKFSINYGLGIKF